MVPQKLIVATRSSRLAVAQTLEAVDGLKHVWPETTVELLKLVSPGDRDLVTPLTDTAVPDDFFTRDLDDALLNGSADLAIHSAKDLPQSMRDGLCVAALLEARDIRDALVLRKDWPSGKAPKIIGTSSPKREDQIRGLYPEAHTKPIRGAIDQRLAQLDAGDYDAVIVAACALERLGLADRISRHLPYDPAPQQGRLAVVVRQDRTDLLEALHVLDVRRTAGLVAIVGCPADPELLSMRARSYLQQADVVIHDRLLPDEVLLMIHGKAIPVGKVGGDESTPQQDIHRRMLHEAEQGKLVVRLKGGDPLVFAHLSEELEFLTSWNLRVDVVPTLTAAQVAAAHAVAPLTHRKDGGHLHLLSGHTLHGDNPIVYPSPGTGNIAIYMGVNEAPDIAQRLKEAGWPDETTVWIGERLGYRDEAVRPVTLSSLGEQSIRKPAVFLVGVKAYGSVQRTLFVGTDPEHFLNHGPLIHWPLIKLVSRPLAERKSVLNDCLNSMDGVIFPSRFAVDSFMEALLAFSDARALAGKKCVAVGPATADALRSYGLHADASIDHYGGIRSLAAESAALLSGQFLYPCSDASPRQSRLETLRGIGCQARAEIFYENRRVPYRELPATSFNRVLFTSSSTVEAYFALYPNERTASRTWLAVGPSTAEALRAHGCTPASLHKKH